MDTAAAGVSVSVIVPTYREAENIRPLIERLDAVRKAEGYDLEVLLMDDDSRDGTADVVAELARPWVRLVIRTRNRGLSPAVVEGLAQARGEFLVVMDADLSHPPERIPALLARLDQGDEFVIGSRYVAGGSTEVGWGLFRWLNSRIATLLALPFTRVRDPMAGFFALRKSSLAEAAPLSPVGYKIGLELIVKCGFTRIGEVPIHFEDRKFGESKLALREQLQYIQHLVRLLRFKLLRR